MERPDASSDTPRLLRAVIAVRERLLEVGSWPEAAGSLAT
jgi:hypothetical protein